MSDDLSCSFYKVNLDKDLQQSKIKALKFEIDRLQTSQRNLLLEVEELKNYIESQNKEKTYCNDHHLQTNTSNNNLHNFENVGCVLQDRNDLKQKMEAQRKMLELTINVYMKERSKCNELTKDELKMQKRLHKLISHKAKRQKW